MITEGQSIQLSVTGVVKCQYIEFLELKVGNGKVSILLHRAEALNNYTRPRTKRGLRAFSGIC